MESSVRPKRRYLMPGRLGQEVEAGKRHKQKVPGWAKDRNPMVRLSWILGRLRGVAIHEPPASPGLLDRVRLRFAVPVLTPRRIWFAFSVAAVTDALQLLAGPLGWFLVDEALDVLAMVLISAALGFHVLLLPTFVIELVPVADMLPTWTGCTAVVVMMRKKAQSRPPPLPAKMAQVTSTSTTAESGR